MAAVEPSLQAFLVQSYTSSVAMLLSRPALLVQLHY